MASLKVVFPLQILAIIAVAVGLGVMVAGRWNNSRVDDFKISRELRTQQILSKMGTIQAGDILPVFDLRDSAGRKVDLKAIVRSPTLISFFDPGCGACLSDMKMFWRLAGGGPEREKIIFVTSSQPQLAAEAQQKLGTNFRVLFDLQDGYGSELGISTVPLNVTVDSCLRITMIVAGALTEDECKNILRGNPN